jgi:hypothetical protein
MGFYPIPRANGNARMGRLLLILERKPGSGPSRVRALDPKNSNGPIPRITLACQCVTRKAQVLLPVNSAADSSAGHQRAHKAARVTPPAYQLGQHCPQLGGFTGSGGLVARVNALRRQL